MTDWIWAVFMFGWIVGLGVFNITENITWWIASWIPLIGGLIREVVK